MVGNDDSTEEGELERFTVGGKVGGFVSTLTRNSVGI